MATPMGPQYDESDEEVVIAPQRRLSDWLRADSPDGKEHDPSDARPLNERPLAVSRRVAVHGTHEKEY